MRVDSYIKKLCDEIVGGFSPQKIILFGSYANGTPNEDSDIDLLVIMPYEGNELDKMGFMTPEIWEWIDKAEGDWATVLREAAVTIDPNPDAVCFHAQQCAEKYLKARLVLADIAFRKSHDLLYLLELIVQVEPTWRYLHDSLFELTTFAVAIRYPGLDATEDQARKSVEHCRAVRSTVRPALGLMLEKS